jgi:hypothetical protein
MMASVLKHVLSTESKFRTSLAEVIIGDVIMRGILTTAHVPTSIKVLSETDSPVRW